MRYHIILLALLLTQPIQAQVKDYTTKVKNTATAWGGTGTYKAGDVTCVEYYSAGHFYHGTFSQTITGLPIGVYEAEVYFNSSCAAWDCAEICGNGTTGRTHLFLNDAEVDIPIYNIKQITEPALYTVKNIHVTDGTLYLGARNDREGANWHLIRMKSLTYMGTDARSLYDAQFPMIRKARLAKAASTCPNNQEMIQQAIDESLVASVYDTPEHLQALYDNISNAIKESEEFETRKASRLKSITGRLSTYLRTWNMGTREVCTEQLNILLPAVERACIAKDSECDVDAIEEARQALNAAMTSATGISVSVLPSAAASSAHIYTLDGRKTLGKSKGLFIQNGTKLIR